MELASGSYGVCEAEYERLIDRGYRRATPPSSETDDGASDDSK